MVKKDLIIIADYSTETPLTLQEICDIFDLAPGMIDELIQYDVITPKGQSSELWLFDLNHLLRIKTALRLQRDLEVNLAGAAVILNLLEELKELRAHSDMLERHLIK